MICLRISVVAVPSGVIVVLREVKKRISVFTEIERDYPHKLSSILKNPKEVADLIGIAFDDFAIAEQKNFATNFRARVLGVDSAKTQNLVTVSRQGLCIFTKVLPD